MRSQGCARCWPLFTGGAARGLRCRTRHPSHGSHPVWLLDFCRCSNQKCCAAPPRIMRQCCEAAMARVNTSLDCCVHATSTEAQMRDNSILTLRFCQLDGSEEATDAGLCVFRPRPRSNSPPGERRVRCAVAAWASNASSRPVTSCAAATPRAMARLPDPAIPEAFRKRTLPGPAAPAGPARLPRCKTQYKCGKSRLRNNHPLGKPGYDQRLLLAPGSLLSLE